MPYISLAFPLFLLKLYNQLDSRNVYEIVYKKNGNCDVQLPHDSDGEVSPQSADT